SVGDSNLDGSFTTGDLVLVFEAAKYETGAAATWEEGDWNGDLLFDSNDFVFVFTYGDYQG
ncbi:MAG: hypothetical protein KDB27_33080, partial [Planctomycetales bacterium]|nr:hypothetical protein [Planctomycetales bacterium]